MKRDPNDRRSRRTRRRLRDALVDLIIERGYSAVTVQDILDRADVGRSTFYSHFYDKEDLLLSGFADPDWPQGAQLGAAGESLSLGFFAHAAAHYRLYRALVGERGGEIILYHAERSIVAALEARLDALAAAGASLPPRDGLASTLAGALLGMMRWWLDHDMPMPADDMDARFHTLALGMLGQ